ncbi:peptidase inhibitor family I36 protein [Streptomyces eurythermus]|uniref:peptidase inhibitor family I36 protein n=1 Tax=Streptomyces eurythermus TaxID=42237 RepID=UPI0036FBFB31
MSALIRKAVSSVMLAAGLAAGAVLAAPAAQASTSDCPSGYFCMWPEYNNNGAIKKYSYHVSDLGTFRNRDRSSYNHMSQAAMELYSQTGYVGFIACSRPGAVWTVHNPAMDTESLYKVPSC